MYLAKINYTKKSMICEKRNDLGRKKTPVF